jgi:hypothetical protein
MLPVGFDRRTRPTWSRWSPTRTESFTTPATWLDSVHAEEAEALFPHSWPDSTTPYWRHVLMRAIDYLIDDLLRKYANT